MSKLSLSGAFLLTAKLATRNLRRDLRRTLIATSAVSLGLALFIFSDQIQQGSYQSLIRMGVSTQAGHLVVQLEGYQANPDQDRYLTGSAQLGARLSAQLREAQVEATLARRAQLTGILQSAASSARAQLLAIDPHVEPQVSDWHQRLSPADRPRGEAGAPIPSEWLRPEDTRGILLGAQLAKRLDLTVGDKLIYTYQHNDEVESLLFRVRGVLKLGSEEQEARTAIITLAGASAALKASDVAHQLTFHLHDLRDLERGREALRVGLASTEQAPPRSYQTRGAQRPTKTPLVLLDWREALPALYQFTLKDRQSALVIFFIMGLMIATGVLNTIAMSALERRRYFGVMMALGLTPRLIGGLLVAEGLIVGVAASLLGLLLGVLISWPAVVYGLDMSSMMGEGMEIGGVFIDTRIYAVWNPSGLFAFTLTSVILCVSASFIPAWRTARISALTAMRGPEANE